MTGIASPDAVTARRPTATQVVAALGALAQESRLAVFRALVQAGPDGLSAGRISEMTALAPSALTFHLKSLTAASLVSSSKSGRFVYYRANYPAMESLLSFLTENCCAGDPACLATSRNLEK